MIKSLRIQNLATIEDIELNFKTGFSILTGETGVGKSIIIDGIKLLLGEKGSADLIRTGKNEASVEAIFHLPRTEIEEKNLFPEKEIFIQRKIPKQGTGKGYLNGILVPIKKLKQLSPYLVDIYGQNDHDFLLHVENHLNYLDSYAQALAIRKKVTQVAHELKKLFKVKQELEEKERDREQRLDFLDFQIKEIEKAELKSGEEEDLHYERNILKNAEKISTLVEKALALSYAEETSVSSQLSQLQNVVSELSDYDKTFKETTEAINQFSIVFEEFSDFLIKFKEKQIISPEKLESIEERLSQVEKLKRKYGTNIPEILSYLQKAKKEYQELSSSQEKLEDLAVQTEAVFKEYKKQAEKLARLRKQRARDLEKNILEEIALLGMKKAKFKIKFDTIPLKSDEKEKVNEKGTEEVEFLISPNPGEELRPLRKIASGGELSRIMLALRSIGKEGDQLKTLIFDEIDAGIGGKTAEFVAKKLRHLSRQHQVICITHLPQIASFPPHHFKIDKQVSQERTFTTVKILGFEDRVTEIARLISGIHITETSLKNAREMLTHNLRD
ncbi:MAG: DNA repair protein RecN [Candidatus Aminicenantes bacterium]|nr:DNA repair protein RecN [Candidatus Aminicenantes bacterium]